MTGNRSIFEKCQIKWNDQFRIIFRRNKKLFVSSGKNLSDSHCFVNNNNDWYCVRQCVCTFATHHYHSDEMIKRWRHNSMKMNSNNNKNRQQATEDEANVEEKRKKIRRNNKAQRSAWSHFSHNCKNRYAMFHTPFSAFHSTLKYYYIFLVV